jgi:Ca-activated chloride channel family protein
MWAARQSVSLAFSSTDFASSIRPTFRQRMMWVPAALTLLTMAVLIVALAGPREGRQETIANTEGIAIEIVVDRSGSMRAMDFKKQDVPVDRLTAVKDVVGRFVLGEGDLEGRFSDLIGLVTFARNADGMTPPTLDHPFLVSQLNESSIVNRNSEDGTAIGDAIGLAVEKLAALDKNQKQEIESKVIILLTDGENNSGSLEPIQAAELAKMMNIKVYTIGVGTKGRAPVPVTNAIGRQIIRWMDVNIDEKTLQKIADTTNGKYFRATDTESLEEIYAEIDRLEKSKVEERQYVDYRELAVRPIHYGGLTFPPVALWAFLLLGLQMVLKNTFFREFG